MLTEAQRQLLDEVVAVVNKFLSQSGSDAGCAPSIGARFPVTGCGWLYPTSSRGHTVQACSSPVARSRSPPKKSAIDGASHGEIALRPRRACGAPVPAHSSKDAGERGCGNLRMESRQVTGRQSGDVPVPSSGLHFKGSGKGSLGTPDPCRFLPEDGAAKPTLEDPPEPVRPSETEVREELAWYSPIQHLTSFSGDFDELHTQKEDCVRLTHCSVQFSVDPSSRGA